MTANPRAAARLLQDMRYFIPFHQRQALVELTRSCRDLDNTLLKLATTIAAMPKTCGQDDKGEQAIAYLRYFAEAADWYITNRYAGSPDDDIRGEQYSAFGLCCVSDCELGYVSVHEISRHPSVNIDLHWTPKTVAECRAEYSKRRGF